MNEFYKTEQQKDFEGQRLQRYATDHTTTKATNEHMDNLAYKLQQMRP